MSGGNRPTMPEKPTGKARAVEILKDVLIVLLTCSAVYLALQTTLAREMRAWMFPEGEVSRPAAEQRTQAAQPYQVAVRNEWGLYGTGYNAAEGEQTFEVFRGLFGRALAAGMGEEAISERRWRELLEAPGVYCEFQGAPPMSVLSLWMGGGGGLNGNAEVLLLAWDGAELWLCRREGEEFRAARTGLDYETELSGLLEGFSPNGAAFAYTLAETDQVYASVEPYVLVPMTVGRPAIYQAASPNFVGDDEALRQLLDGVGFVSDGAAYEVYDGLSISEGGARLRVSHSGTVTGHGEGDDAHWSVSMAGMESTMGECAQSAWELLSRTSPWMGEAVTVLTGAEETAEGTRITFHYRLNGIPVLVGEEGWAAQFLIKDGAIAEFTIHLRTYTAGSETSTLPPPRLAAAALRSMPAGEGKLTLCYLDNGGAQVSAGWITE